MFNIGNLSRSFLLLLLRRSAVKSGSTDGSAHSYSTGRHFKDAGARSEGVYPNDNAVKARPLSSNHQTSMSGSRGLCGPGGEGRDHAAFFLQWSVSPVTEASASPILSVKPMHLCQSLPSRSRPCSRPFMVTVGMACLP